MVLEKEKRKIFASLKGEQRRNRGEIFEKSKTVGQCRRRRTEKGMEEMVWRRKFSGCVNVDDGHVVNIEQSAFFQCCKCENRRFCKKCPSH